MLCCILVSASSCLLRRFLTALVRDDLRSVVMSSCMLNISYLKYSRRFFIASRCIVLIMEEIVEIILDSDVIGSGVGDEGVFLLGCWQF